MISLLQKQKITNAVRLQKLKAGQSPSNKEVVESVVKSERGHLSGEPYYKAMNILPHTITNSTVWNRTFGNLKKDLDILFEANVMLNNTMVSFQEKSDIENSLLNSKLNLTSMKFDKIKTMIEQSTGLQGYSENFKDFKGTENESTAEVNLKEKSVTLEKSNISKRYDLSESTVTVTPITSHSSAEHYGKENSILNDFCNEYEIFKYVTQSNGEFVLEIRDDLEKPLFCNTVTLSVSSSSSLSAMLYLSEDGIAFKGVYIMEGNRDLEWIFGETTIKAVKIVIRKPGADGYKDGSYDHYFILKSLGLSRNIYEHEGIFLSKPMKFLGAVDKLTLNAEDMIFNNTNIIYSLGIERNDKKMQWSTVENGEPSEMNLLSESEEIVNRNDKNYGQSVGDGIYRVYKLPPRTNIDSIKLNPGYQMWYREHLEGIGGYNYTLNLLSYDASKIKYRNFVDAEEYQTKLLSQSLDVFTQYVECEEDQVVSFPYATVTGETSLFQQVLFCNGVKAAQKKGNFTLSLKKGLNKIIMFLYLGSGKNQEVYATEATLKVNFKEITDNVYAFPKMKYVNPYALKNENLAENYVYYTVENGHILVKHTPNANVANYNNEMRYYLSYRYLSENSPYVQYKNREPYVKIRVKALLISNDQGYTPKITNYQLSSE